MYNASTSSYGFKNYFEIHENSLSVELICFGIVLQAKISFWGCLCFNFLFHSGFERELFSLIDIMKISFHSWLLRNLFNMIYLNKNGNQDKTVY